MNESFHNPSALIIQPYFDLLDNKISLFEIIDVYKKFNLYLCKKRKLNKFNIESFSFEK